MASKAQKAIEGLIARGFTPVQAAVLAGNIQQESGFNPDAYNPKEDAFGGIQWRLDRKKNLEDYAKSTGRKASDPEAQMDFLVQEMTGAVGNEAANAAAFLAAQDPYTANAALKKYIRYGDNSEGARLQNALGYMGGGNALTGQPTQVADASFVNPSFGGAAMPGVPQWNGSGYALPGDGQPAPSMSAPTPGGSDDQLLNQFSAPAPPAATPAQPQQYPTVQPYGANPDDELLKSFLGESAAPQASGAPVSASEDDALLRSFLPATPGSGEMAVAPAGLKPGSKEYAAWAVEQAKAGKTLPQVSEVIEPPAPTGLLDKAGAAAASYMEAMPVLGPAWLDAAQKARAAVQGVPVEAIQQETDAARAANPLTSSIGSVAGTVAPFLAAGAAAPRLMGVSGTIPQQMMMGGLSNALIGGGDTLMRGGTGDEALGNALISGGIGGAVPAVLGAAGKIGNALLGKVSPETAKLAELARNKYDIPLGVGQISENQMVRFADDVVNKLPFSGGTLSTGQQQAALNREVAKLFGEKAEKITPDVMARAKTRLGQAFEDVATQTGTIPADPTFDQSMLNILTDAQGVLTPDELKPLMNQFDQIMSKFQQGGNAIDGKVYQSLTHKDAPLDVLSNRTNIGVYARKIRDALDDALERAAPPAVRDDLLKARSQYKVMKTIEGLAEKGVIGDINPALLLGAVRSSYDNMAYGGGGDLAELARIGQAFMKKPPSSGTSERMLVMNALTKLAPLATVGGMANAAMGVGSLPLTIAAGAAGVPAYLAAAKGAGALMRNGRIANKLIGNSLGVPANTSKVSIPNLLLRAASGDAAVDQPRVPLSIMVRGGNPLLAGP